MPQRFRSRPLKESVRPASTLRRRPRRQLGERPRPFRREPQVEAEPPLQLDRQRASLRSVLAERVLLKRAVGDHSWVRLSAIRPTAALDQPAVSRSVPSARTPATSQFRQRQARGPRRAASSPPARPAPEFKELPTASRIAAVVPAERELSSRPQEPVLLEFSPAAQKD